MSKPGRVPFGGNQSAVQTQPAPAAAPDEVESPSTTEADDSTIPAAEPQVDAIPMMMAAPPIQTAVPVKGEKLFRIRPRVNVPRCRIGTKTYSFRSGVEQEVNEDVRRHLAERGII